jgi:hypothetical protein
MLANAPDVMGAGISKWDDDAVAKAMGQLRKSAGSGSLRHWEVETPD